MTDYTTETRTFVGDKAINAGDGYLGFRLGQPYHLRYERWEDGTIRLLLNPPHSVPQIEVLVSEEQFEKRFVR